MKKISIFGSTGSIGTNSLDVILKSPKNDFKVLALTANNNYELLAKQAVTTNAQMAVIYNEAHYKPLKTLLQHTKIEVTTGIEGMLAACDLNNDLIVAGIVGSAGLRTTYQSITKGADVALANKESLVCAGKIMTDAAKKHNVNLIPTDSEHNAIFQVLERRNQDSIEKIILTASGGPFRTFNQKQLENVTVKQAVAHPKWKMGPKISADCATLMNKGLEIIEAHYLFDMPTDKIEVLIHPQSIIHSLVSYKDGSSLAQLGNADMRIPISYALYWPKRSNNVIAELLDLAKISTLQFEHPNHQLFPALNLCRKALSAGNAYTIMLNASNEIAIDNFLQNKIRFIDIVTIVEQMLERTIDTNITTIEQVINFDQECRIKTQELIKLL
jgi:1-deoxy-D-xylulose-5-phosphate reductoisomerase